MLAHVVWSRTVLSCCGSQHRKSNSAVGPEFVHKALPAEL